MSNLLPEAIILAGGLGTRLKSVTGDLPKPLVKVAGKPFLEWLLTYWVNQGVERFIFSIAYKHELIQNHFGKKFASAEIDYAVDDGAGTGGGILQAMPKLKSKNTFLVLNGDTYFNVELPALLAFHRSKSAEATLALLQRENCIGGQVVLSNTGRIQAFQSAGQGLGWMNGGVYLFERSFFENSVVKRPLSLEAECLPRAIAAERSVYGFESASFFTDIGTPESYNAFNTKMQQENL